MKKIMQFFGFALLLVCCSFTKGNTATRATNIEHNEVSFIQKSTSSPVELSFFKAIQTSETTLNQSGSTTFVSSYDEPTVKPFTTNKLLEEFIEFQFSQYIKTDKNFLILSKKSDLIFPFHYHW